METIRDKLESIEPNSPFGVKDFLDCGSYDAVRKHLIRAAEKNIIKRIMDGVYYKPKYSKLTNELIPISMDSLAHYLADRYGWQIAVSKELALNYLGLSTQVPAKYVYLSTGPYRSFKINDIELSFKHTANRYLLNLSNKSSLLVQAIFGLGKENINERDLKTITQVYSKDEINKVLSECKNVPVWVYETIKEIRKEYD